MADPSYEELVLRRFADYPHGASRWMCFGDSDNGVHGTIAQQLRAIDALCAAELLKRCEGDARDRFGSPLYVLTSAGRRKLGLAIPPPTPTPTPGAAGVKPPLKAGTVALNGTHKRAAS
jgi:hypothetical protein